MLEYSINPIEGFVIERFHGLIFDENTLLNQEPVIEINKNNNTVKHKQKQIKKNNSLKLFEHNK
jgi:hypothetical protein